MSNHLSKRKQRAKSQLTVALSPTQNWQMELRRAIKTLLLPIRYIDTHSLHENHDINNELNQSLLIINRMTPVKKLKKK